MPTRLHLPIALIVLSGVFATAAPAQNQTSDRAKVKELAPTKYTSRQLKLYALALLEIQKVKQTEAVRMESANENEKSVLRSRAKSENRAILQRYDLDVATFNAMTDAVDTRPKVRGQVRQTVMQHTLALWK